MSRQHYTSSIPGVGEVFANFYESTSGSESDGFDQDWLQDPDADYNGDRFDAILRLRKDKKPIPRKLRTHNLLLTEQCCPDWGPAEGIRELVQNFLDGICIAFNVTLDSVVFKHRVRGGPNKKTWIDSWTATAEKAFQQSVEYGRIAYDRNKRSLVIINERVALSQSVLVYGKTDKRNRRDLIGGHGEGMKIGILQLALFHCPVRYRTGGEIWKFGMRRARGSADETLHYMTSDSRKPRTNLEVSISDIEDEYFKLETFLPLSRDVQWPVKGSMCPVGCLLESPSRPELAANRVYVKGLYVYYNSEILVSVNFATASVDRDRNIRMVDRELKKNLAKIWGTVFASEKNLAERPYTARYLDIANKDPNSVEFRCMAYMSHHDAKCLYNQILKQIPKAFPCKRGAEEEAKLISSSLKKHPYPVHENFFQLLNKLPEVSTVYEAQEKAFLSDCSECTSSIYDLPLSRMIKSYTLRILGPDNTIEVKFLNPATSEMDALLKGRTLFCSQSLVQIEYESEKQATRAKLDALRSAERELRKCLKPLELSGIYLKTMEYVASAEFRSYLCGGAQSLTGLPATTKGSGGGPDCRRRSCTREHRSPSTVGVKRTLEVDEQIEANESHTPSTESRSSPSKKLKTNPQSISIAKWKENAEEDVVTEGTGPGNMGQAKRHAPQGNCIESNKQPAPQNATTSARRRSENQQQPGTQRIAHHEAPQAAMQPVSISPGAERNIMHSPQSQGATTTTNAQRMRFLLGPYEVELTHKLTPTPAFAVEHIFGDPTTVDSGDNRDISVNLGTVFPCCSTNEGDVLFTTSIRKQAS